MKKYLKVVVVLILMLSLCGCTKYVKTDKKTKGERVVDNILCKTNQTEKKYEPYKDKMDTNIKKLQKCDKFSISNKQYNGLWESIFIKPLAWLILKLGYAIKNFGLSIIILGLAIRLILLPFTIKTSKQSDAMKKAQPKLQKIEKKYANKTDQESMMMKSQETMAVYREFKINPLSSCLIAFIQLPVFLAFLEAIYRLPVVFEGKLLGLNLGIAPSKGITTSGNIWLSIGYILVLVLVLASTYFSFKNAMSQSQNTMPKTEGMPDPASQTKMMTYMMIIMIGFASLSLSTAISLYWITTNVFAIVQNMIIRKLIK